MSGQDEDLVPERLRVDEQAVASHHPALASEREMVGVLADRDRDGEVDRIAPTGEELVWPERGVDALAALATVLLPLVANDAVAPLDDVDLVGLLELSCPHLQPPTALGADPVGFVQDVDGLDDRELGLVAGAVTGLWLFLLLVAGILRSLLRRGREKLALPRLEFFLEQRDLERELFGGLFAFQAGELGGEILEPTEETAVLILQKQCDLSQPLNVPLRVDPNRTV